MKIFTSSQVHEIDAYTIKNEPIPSINLMERAASVLLEWLVRFIDVDDNILICSGPGNNGGDGLALTRLLLQKGYKAKACLVRISNKLSENAQINFDRLKHTHSNSIFEIDSIDNMPDCNEYDVLIDAIFGSGLTRPTVGLVAEVINRMNDSSAIRIALDSPSGLFGEDNTLNNGAIYKAHHTLTLQFPVLAYHFVENEKYVGMLHVLPIGLHPEIIKDTYTPYNLLEPDDIEELLLKRKKYAHKGNFGHALLIAGSFGKMGAAVLSAKACLRTGVGLLTSHVPLKGYSIMQISVPENMMSVDESEFIFTNIENFNQYSAIGIGPGLGVKHNTVKGLERIINTCEIPLVLDADALNILSENPKLLDALPKNSILTPHPREFSRLFGNSENSYQQLVLQQQNSTSRGVFIVCKGANTIITTPNGEVFINSTGNPGMATAGSGDVLTGIILSFLAQAYTSKNAAILGVFIHGLSADIAIKSQSEESLIASDIIDCLGSAFKELK